MLNSRILQLLPVAILVAVASGCSDQASAGLQPTEPAFDMDYAQNPYVYLYLSPAAAWTRLDTFQQVNASAFLQNYGTVRANSSDSWNYSKTNMINGTTLSGTHYFRTCIPGENWSADGSFYAYSSVHGTLNGDAYDARTCYMA